MIDVNNGKAEFDMQFCLHQQVKQYARIHAAA
jgi:hypothetical protein